MTAPKRSGGASAPSISTADVDGEVYATALANAKRMLAYFESDEFKDGERLGRELLRIGDMGPEAAAEHLEAHPPTPLAIAWLIMEARRLGASAAASSNARKKVHPGKMQVIAAWKKRTDLGQSKDAFAKEWAQRLKHDYGETVSPDTIADRWLKAR